MSCRYALTHVEPFYSSEQLSLKDGERDEISQLVVGQFYQHFLKRTMLVYLRLLDTLERDAEMHRR